MFMDLVNSYKDDFPFFKKSQTIYLDSSAMTLRPQQVIDSVTEYYSKIGTNIFRSEHELSKIASGLFEEARGKVASLIGATNKEIIFSHNCSDSINMLVELLELSKEDQVINSVIDHHSNHLPYLNRSQLITVGLTDNAKIDVEGIERKITQHTKLIAINMVSNVTGELQPFKEIIQIAKKHDVLTFLDASQAASHMKINVKELDCDFLAFSSHKCFGPSGTGILYGKYDLLNKFKPKRFGGGMVRKIAKEKIDYKDPPYIFEVGTPAIESVIGFSAALDYIMEVGQEVISHRLKELNRYFLSEFKKLDKFKLLFPKSEGGMPIFAITPCKGLSLEAFSHIISNRNNIAFSSGFQCCQTLYNYYDIKDGSMRFSFHFYNDKADADFLLKALNECSTIL
jgi:cysteine desulfurase/selenocysteine lyase